MGEGLSCTNPLGRQSIDGLGWPPHWRSDVQDISIARGLDGGLFEASGFAFWKGRVGLYAILKALRVGRGDYVAVPGYTCVAVPAPVCFVGANPVYVDIEKDTYNISLDGIRNVSNGSTSGDIKAVIVQHTYGLPADTAPIVDWAKGKGIAVIEDCCHAIGGQYLDASGEWKEVGSLGDAAFFSGQWSKPVSTGLGGWIYTRDPSLAEAVRRFHTRECISPSFREVLLLAGQVLARGLFSSPRVYWTAISTYRSFSRRRIFIGSSEDAELQGQMPRDFAKRMSGFQLWLLRKRLKKLRSLLHHRRRLKVIYDDALRAAGLPVLAVPRHADPVLLRYPVRVGNKAQVLVAARKARIEIGDWFDHPLHPHEANAAAFGYRTGMCPEAERAAREVVNLPLHGRVTERFAQETVAFLKRVGDFDCLT